MSLRDPLTRRAGLKAGFGLAAIGALSLLLAGCGFTPVYGPGDHGENLAFHYAEPASPLEQIVYQDLAANLSTPPGPDSPLVTVSIKADSRTIGRTANASVFSSHEAILTGTLTVTDPGNNKKILFKETRSATATYDTNGQLVADQAAIEDARTRAAHRLADTFRLMLIGAFAGSASTS